MFSFNLYNWQLQHSIRLCSLLFSSCLCLLLTDPPDHFEKVNIATAITVPRLKIAVEISHKLVWREPLEHLVHPKELRG